MASFLDRIGRAISPSSYRPPALEPPDTGPPANTVHGHEDPRMPGASSGPLAQPGPDASHWDQVKAQLAPKSEDEQALEAAHARMQGMFTIVDQRDGESAPNAITQAEYEKYVQMHADISRGKGDIQIDTGLIAGQENKDKYKDALLGDLARIMQTEGGREMLSQLHDNVLRNENGEAIDPETGAVVTDPAQMTHRKTSIGPSFAKRRDDDGKVLGYDEDVNRSYQPKANGDASAGRLVPDASEADAGFDLAGASNPKVGSDARVGYSPDTFAGGIRADVALFHELRHAHDATTGTMAQGMVPKYSQPKGADSIIDEGEVMLREHQAVGLGRYHGTGMTENAYRKERAAIGAGQLGAVEGDVNMPQRTSYQRPEGKPSSW